MIINEMNLPIRDLVAQYNEDDSSGRVSAMSGCLDVRPEYQREFVYNEKQQSAVINTVMNQFPLNIMYFVRRPDDTFEVLDGQQRIISICRYIINSAISARILAATGGFNMVNFNNLGAAAKEAFLDYPLRVYICEGTDKEKLDWFQIINIAGEVLEQQESRNALYHGPWLSNAKSAFSRRNCTAHRKYGKYMVGDYIRQKYLETAFCWLTARCRRSQASIPTCSPARKSISTSGSSTAMSLCPPIMPRVVSAPSAGRPRTSRTCTPTILSRGARAGRRCGRIVRCSARPATLRNRIIDWLRAQGRYSSVPGFFLL